MPGSVFVALCVGGGPLLSCNCFTHGFGHQCTPYIQKKHSRPKAPRRLCPCECARRWRLQASPLGPAAALRAALFAVSFCWAAFAFMKRFSFRFLMVTPSCFVLNFTVDRFSFFPIFSGSD